MKTIITLVSTISISISPLIYNLFAPICHPLDDGCENNNVIEVIINDFNN